MAQRDLSLKFPSVFDFMTSVYVDKAAAGNIIDEKLAGLRKIQAETMASIRAHADFSLFRDDIDPNQALNIINWALAGFAASKITDIPGTQIGEAARENYDHCLEELKNFLNNRL